MTCPGVGHVALLLPAHPVGVEAGQDVPPRRPGARARTADCDSSAWLRRGHSRACARLAIVSRSGHSQQPGPEHVSDGQPGPAPGPGRALSRGGTGAWTPHVAQHPPTSFTASLRTEPCPVTADVPGHRLHQGADSLEAGPAESASLSPWPGWEGRPCGARSRRRGRRPGPAADGRRRCLCPVRLPGTVGLVRRADRSAVRSPARPRR